MAQLGLPVSWLRLLLSFLDRGLEGTKLSQQIRSKLCTHGSDNQTVSVDIEDKETLEVVLAAIKKGQETFQSMESFVQTASSKLGL